jgi:hypothetical protein
MNAPVLIFVFALVVATVCAKYYQPNIFAQQSDADAHTGADIYKILGDFFARLSAANSGQIR